MLRAFLLASILDCRTRVETPCVPGTPLAAYALWSALEKHSTAWTDHDFPPPERYGTCTAHEGTLREADGSLVAELGCGARVVRAGIVDEHGVQVGMRGDELVARKGRRWSAIRCIANGPVLARCAYEPFEGRTNQYVVAAALGDRILFGDAAIELLRGREIVEMHVGVTCH